MLSTSIIILSFKGKIINNKYYDCIHIIRLGNGYVRINKLLENFFLYHDICYCQKSNIFVK